jgi:hypothetical protein
MPVTTEDRPIKIVREEVIDQLIMNYGHEKISLDAFEKRLDKAMATEDPVELVGLVEDLDLDVDKDYLTKKRRELSMNSDIPVESAHQGVDETDYMVHIFGGSQRSGIWNVAKELVAINVFGGGDIDLSDAHLNHKTTRIKVYSLFGGSTIYVPEGINVSVRSFCIFGGVDNRAPSLDDARVPTVVIEGIVIFSGINIKIKRTVKESLMRFADGLKNILS